VVAAAVLGYFLVVVLGVVLVVFPASRERLVTTLLGALNSGALPFLRAGSWLLTSLQLFVQAIRNSAGGGARFVFGNPLLASAAMTLLVAPSLLIYSLNTPPHF
jgi:peptidoglycan L-alanyl-D-glutamate endopeptidase CwlK